MYRDVTARDLYESVVGTMILNTVNCVLKCYNFLCETSSPGGYTHEA